MFTTTDKQYAETTVAGKLLKSTLRADATKQNDSNMVAAKAAKQDTYMRTIVASDKNVKTLVVAKFDCPVQLASIGDCVYGDLVHGATIRHQNKARELAGLRKLSESAKERNTFALLKARAIASGAVISESMGVEDVAEAIMDAIS